MLTDDPPTNSELDRRFDRLENSINNGFARIDQQIASLVTQDMFSLFRESIQQRVSAAEERQGTLADKHDADIKDLRDDLEQSDRQRSADRRNVLKIVATVGIGLFAAMVTALGIFLPMLT